MEETISQRDEQKHCFKIKKFMKQCLGALFIVIFLFLIVSLRILVKIYVKGYIKDRLINSLKYLVFGLDFLYLIA